MELQPQQEYEDWTNMLKLLYLKDPDTYLMHPIRVKAIRTAGSTADYGNFGYLID